ncbi:hypothetical protein H8A92_09295 [Bradyrhizobium sp. 10BB]|nr:hypothetical protein [Bradyrhizobium acaciae]MCC8979020.1 hypothetical protein [Bradyrhizobium acaciae]
MEVNEDRLNSFTRKVIGDVVAKMSTSLMLLRDKLGLLIVARVERLGVPIAYVKDRRAIVKQPPAHSAPPVSRQKPAGENIAQAALFD